MKIRYWGVRGSVPVPGKTTVSFGGNTACVSVEINGMTIICDSGTGIRECGNYLLSKGGKIHAVILISHTHWDHIQGFPFFIPAYIAGNKFSMYGPPSDVHDLSLKRIMEMQTRFEYFPIRTDQLGADIEYIDCHEGTVRIDGLDISACRLNHPVACLAYKITADNKTFVYGGDHEPFRNVYRDTADTGAVDEEFLEDLDENTREQNEKIVAFCKNADLVSWDAQYTAEEYESKKGWGHSSHETDIEFAANAGIKHIVFSHHDPMNNDEKLDGLEKKFQAIARERGFMLDFAREGMELDL